jgi:hypothetical protein
MQEISSVKEITPVEMVLHLCGRWRVRYSSRRRFGCANGIRGHIVPVTD